MQISSDIKYRFAKTIIKSKVRNTHELAQETKFFVVLPEAAFISGFIMEVDNTNYTAYLKRKEEAQRVYDEVILNPCDNFSKYLFCNFPGQK